MTTTPHCESCGSTDPEDIARRSYTGCCNELVCHGDGLDTYGTEAVNTRACCWAKAREAGVTEGWRH